MKASTTTTSAANSFLRRRGGVHGVHGVHAGVQVQQPLQQSTTSIRYVTTLALYVEKFHTEHEYGMTYFDLGLISLKTFVKVNSRFIKVLSYFYHLFHQFLFIYCEIFLYVYQLKSSQWHKINLFSYRDSFTVAVVLLCPRILKIKF